MSADEPLWQELREFELCQPSPLAFRALAALLDTWPVENQAAAIEYADRLLASWPDEHRVAPWSWCKAASRGAVTPSWRLVRALQLESGHLGKGKVDLRRLARRAPVHHVTELTLPYYSDYHEISFLYHCSEAFSALKKLRAVDKRGDGDVRALANSPLWQTLESFEVNGLTESMAHLPDVSRIVPRFDQSYGKLRHLTLRSNDLIEVWNTVDLPQLRSAAVFIRSIEDAEALAAHEELSQLTTLSIAFRCGFSGSSPWDPFLGNIIEADEAAAEAFFSSAHLDRLESLTIIGYSMGYWGREGLGHLGLESLIASGLLKRLKHLRLELLPLGNNGVAALAPALGKNLERLELVDIYCKGAGAAALSESPGLQSLRHLDLSGNRIDTAGCAALSQVEMPQLETLDLSGPPINPYYWNVGQQPLLDAGAAAWARSPNLRRLKSLWLRNCHLTDESLAAVFGSPHLTKLEELDLSHSFFTATGISQSVVNSSLWQTLVVLGLNDCRLGNDAIAALTQVQHAPALRSLSLAYNSIGPRGAAALASWSVLRNVWHLHLHDNFIGDEGLIALSKSSYLDRLVELDLEQDCWNSRDFTFNDEAAGALASSRALPRLDSLFSGRVDEYHGAAYSPGFTKAGLELLRSAAWTRPPLRASCSDFSKIHDYIESGKFNEQAEFREGDFRNSSFVVNDKEAEGTRHNMQQIRSPAVNRPPEDPLLPRVLTELPELPDDGDEIEGIGARDPRPQTVCSVTFRLSLEDHRRPLPGQAGKFLCDTLQSIFQAAGVGSFETGGGSSRQDESGRHIPTQAHFYLGLQRDPEPALQLMREALWWIGAPENTAIDGKNTGKDAPLTNLHLGLCDESRTGPGRFVQLAALKVERWVMSGEPGHRLDRVPFTPSQRQRLDGFLSVAGATQAAAGWQEIVTSDGGRMRLYAKHLKNAPDFDTLNILVDTLSPQISALIHGLMREGNWLLLPMAFAASEKAAAMIDCEWPKVTIAASAERLYELLSPGAFQWWQRTKG